MHFCQAWGKSPTDGMPGLQNGSVSAQTCPQLCTHSPSSLLLIDRFVECKGSSLCTKVSHWFSVLLCMEPVPEPVLSVLSLVSHSSKLNSDISLSSCTHICKLWELLLLLSLRHRHHIAKPPKKMAVECRHIRLSKAEVPCGAVLEPENVTNKRESLVAKARF